jgi:hypothetical protein
LKNNPPSAFKIRPHAQSQGDVIHPMPWLHPCSEKALAGINSSRCLGFNCKIAAASSDAKWRPNEFMALTDLCLGSLTHRTEWVNTTKPGLTKQTPCPLNSQSSFSCPTYVCSLALWVCLSVHFTEVESYNMWTFGSGIFHLARCFIHILVMGTDSFPWLDTCSVVSKAIPQFI